MKIPLSAFELVKPTNYDTAGIQMSSCFSPALDRLFQFNCDEKQGEDGQEFPGAQGS